MLKKQNKIMCLTSLYTQTLMAKASNLIRRASGLPPPFRFRSHLGLPPPYPYSLGLVHFSPTTVLPPPPPPLILKWRGGRVGRRQGGRMVAQTERGWRGGGWMAWKLG